MKYYLLLLFTILALFFTSCAKNQGPEYDASSYREIKTILYGEVISIKPIVINDSGTGTLVGAVSGTVVGSTAGRGDGSTLLALLGGLVGAYAGSEIAKADAQQLEVKLDSGEYVVVVAKGNQFLVGNRVRIIKDGNKVANVDLVDK